MTPVDSPEPEPPAAAPAPAPEPIPPRADPVVEAPAPSEPRLGMPPPPAEPKPVLVVLPPQAEAFSSVLPELEAELSARELAPTTVRLDALPTAAASSAADRPTPLVIAVGTAATRAALERRLGAFVVFCQVTDVDFDAAPNAYGVDSTPPLDLQLKAWRRLDPTLRTIAAVLGRDETLLAARARDAAAAQGLALELRLASSDQEAIYHFKRIAADVDGLWLLPDNTVLSPRAIREMLEHAAARGVQSLVFTPSLLEWGAVLSVTATDLDLARTLAGVVDVLADGRGDALPPITPLTELEARVNVQAAERLGLEPERDVWIERSGLP